MKEIKVNKINENLERVIKVLTTTKGSYNVSWCRNWAPHIKNEPHIKHYYNLVVKRKYIYINVLHLIGHSCIHTLNNLNENNCYDSESYTLKIDKALL